MDIWLFFMVVFVVSKHITNTPTGSAVFVNFSCYISAVCRHKKTGNYPSKTPSKI